MQKLKEWGMILGIAVIFSALVLATVDAFYPEPQWDDYCRDVYYPQKVPEPIKLDQSCDYQTPDYQAQACYRDRMEPVFTANASGCRVFQECSRCSLDREAAQQSHSRFAFVLIALLGAIAIALGTLYRIDFIGSGFVASGIFLVLYATVRYFADLNRFVRVGVLLFDLIVILWIALKKVVAKEKEEKKLM